jgi:hypothetical protein
LITQKFQSSPAQQTDCPESGETHPSRRADGSSQQRKRLNGRFDAVPERRREQREWVLHTSTHLGEARNRFASKRQAAVVSGDTSRAQMVSIKGSKPVASHVNGATCPNVKAP